MLTKSRLWIDVVLANPVQSVAPALAALSKPGLPVGSGDPASSAFAALLSGSNSGEEIVSTSQPDLAGDAKGSVFEKKTAQSGKEPEEGLTSGATSPSIFDGANLLSLAVPVVPQAPVQPALTAELTMAPVPLQPKVAGPAAVMATPQPFSKVFTVTHAPASGASLQPAAPAPEDPGISEVGLQANSVPAVSGPGGVDETSSAPWVASAADPLASLASQGTAPSPPQAQCDAAETRNVVVPQNLDSRAAASPDRLDSQASHTKPSAVDKQDVSATVAAAPATPATQVEPSRAFTEVRSHLAIRSHESPPPLAIQQRPDPRQQVEAPITEPNLPPTTATANMVPSAAETNLPPTGVVAQHLVQAISSAEPADGLRSPVPDSSDSGANLVEPRARGGAPVVLPFDPKCQDNAGNASGDSTTGAPVNVATHASPPNHQLPSGVETPVADAEPARGPAPQNSILLQDHSAGRVQLTRMVENAGRTEMHIGLRTQAFGSVEVRTTVREAQLGLSVSSEKGDLRDFLIPEVPAMQAVFHQHALRVDDIRFLDHPTGASAGFSTGDGRQPSHREHGRNWTPAPTATATGDEQTLPSFTPEALGKLSVHA